MPGETERAGEGDEPALDAEPAAGRAGTEPAAAAWEPGPDPEPEPEARVEPEVRLAPEPQPDLQLELEPEPALAFEPEPDPDPAPEPRAPAPSLLAEAAFEPEVAPEAELEPAPEPDLEAAGEEAEAPPAAGLLDEPDLLDRLDDPEAANDRDWAGEAAPVAGDDDVPYRPWASGSVLAVAAVLSVGAVAAYLVGLQMAGNQGLDGGSGARQELAAPEAGGPAREAANAAPSPPRAAGLTDSAPAEPAPAPAPATVNAPLPPPASLPAPVPPPLAEASAPPSPPAPPPAARADAAPFRAPPPAATAGWLLVRTAPPGALVTIDGVDRGRTPLALSDMPFDTYRVEVSREGFRSQAAELTLSPAATVASVAIELPRGADPPPAPVVDAGTDSPPAPAVDAAADPPPAPVVGAIRVESRPPGARVVIDGREAGTTPTVVSDVAAGTRSLRIELDGYQPWVASVDVPASDQVRVGASLDLLPER